MLSIHAGIELVLLSGFTDVVDLRVDRPFVFAVRDKEEGGVPIFVGRVMDPRYKGEYQKRIQHLFGK